MNKYCIQYVFYEGKLKVSKDGTLAEKVYEKLKKDILEGRYKPGDELNEVYLAEKLKVSRTPIREAFRRLEHDNIIEVIPHKGAMVLKLSIKDIVNISNIREVLEGLAARIVAVRITDDEIIGLVSRFPDFNRELIKDDYKKAYEAGLYLHDFIMEKADNDQLKSIVDNLKARIDLVVSMNVEVAGRYDKAFLEHKEIIDALRLHDSEAAERVMRRHIRSALLDFVDQNKL